MHAKVYGIPNCGSVKKALQSLKDQEIDVVFHDFKKHGISSQLLDEWMGRVSGSLLLNRKGTTWRQLDEILKSKADTPEGLKALLLEYPTLIKRPVVELNGEVSVGRIDFSKDF